MNFFICRNSKYVTELVTWLEDNIKGSWFCTHVLNGNHIHVAYWFDDHDPDNELALQFRLACSEAIIAVVTGIHGSDCQFVEYTPQHAGIMPYP